MKALITGASSGIGRDMAKILSSMGYKLILVARRKERLEELAKSLSTDCEIICSDLSKENECFNLYDKVKDQNIQILINNAGFGLFGTFAQTDINKELEMININIKAVHILTKLFINDFKKRNSGYILNVASSAAFLPGPLMACYYSTKAYILRLSQAIYEELRREKSKVYIGSLCPGPVATEFDNVANVRFSIKGLSSEFVANYAIKKMFQRKMVIVPGNKMKLSVLLARFISTKFLLKISYHIQNRKK